MITLATLADATAQQVFDQVVAHLRKQGRASKDYKTGGCFYRGPEGLKCAAGCLISDDEYVDRMDIRNGHDTYWLDLIEDGLVPTSRHNLLISCLQDIHDDRDPYDWEREFERLAYEEQLNYTKGE